MTPDSRKGRPDSGPSEKISPDQGTRSALECLTELAERVAGDRFSQLMLADHLLAVAR